MAKRVRKLARELRGTAGEILGLLHDMGFDRYRSPEDMLPAAAVDKVRRAWKKGRRGPSVRSQRGSSRGTGSSRGPGSSRKGPDDGQDLMAQLVPGVVPHDDRAPPAGSPPATDGLDIDAPLEAIAADHGGRDVESERQAELRQALERDRAALDETRAQLDQARKALDRTRRELAEREQALHDQQVALEQREAAVAEDRRALATLREQGAPGLRKLLEDRGLRGTDEFERALGAMAAQRRLRELIPLIEAADAPAVRALLDEILVLVGGAIPEALPHDTVGVQVAPDRSEMEGWQDLRRRLGKVGERLMLHGLRRVAVVGGRPGWQRLLREGIDDRIDLRFQAGDALEVAGNERVDAVVVWGRGLGDDERQGLAEARCVAVAVPDDSVESLCRAVLDALDDD